MKKEMRAIWLAIIVLLAAVAAVSTYIVLRTVGMALPATIAATGAAFVATASIALRAREFLETPDQ